jgi:hypothetical protein
MNIPKSQAGEDIPRRDMHFYSIAGWMAHPENPTEAFAYGGYFRHDPSDNELLNGQLIDVWGPSEIGGLMESKILEFEKLYAHRDEPIKYKFEKQNGIWVGEYSGGRVGKGKTECVVTLVHNNAFDLACGVAHPRL